MSDFSYGTAEKCSACSSFDINRTQMTYKKTRIKVKAVCTSCHSHWFEYYHETDATDLKKAS